MALRRFRWFKIIIFPMLLGGLWRLNERYVWMSMREVSVNAANPILEERYWDLFPSQCLRFWPLFIRKSQDVASFLEKTNPVIVKTSMMGMGSFVTDIKLLSPHVVVEWQGSVWCISKEGRMWSLSEGSFGFKELRIPQKPLWRVLGSSVVSGDEQFLPGGVFPSIFSIDTIDDFVKGLGSASWFDGVEEVALDRRAGDDLYRLRYVRGGRNYTILIQRNKYEWQELSLALESILDRLQQEDSEHLIDATYKDRIVERKLSTGAVEGSSK